MELTFGIDISAIGQRTPKGIVCEITPITGEAAGDLGKLCELRWNEPVQLVVLQLQLPDLAEASHLCWNAAAQRVHTQIQVGEQREQSNVRDAARKLVRVQSQLGGRGEASQFWWHRAGKLTCIELPG